jgi:hypothetical protein
MSRKLPLPLFRKSGREIVNAVFFFLYMFLANQQFISHSFSPLLPLTEVSPQPSAIPGGNPPGDWQSAVGWRDAGFEPGTAGQQSMQYTS